MKLKTKISKWLWLFTGFSKPFCIHCLWTPQFAKFSKNFLNNISIPQHKSFSLMCQAQVLSSLGSPVYQMWNIEIFDNNRISWRWSYGYSWETIWRRAEAGLKHFQLLFSLWLVKTLQVSSKLINSDKNFHFPRYYWLFSSYTLLQYESEYRPLEGGKITQIRRFPLYIQRLTAKKKKKIFLRHNYHKLDGLETIYQCSEHLFVILARKHKKCAMCSRNVEAFHKRY